MVPVETLGSGLDLKEVLDLDKLFEAVQALELRTCRLLVWAAFDSQQALSVA